MCRWGMVNANRGATMAEAWMPRDALESDPDYRKVFDIPWVGDNALLRPTGLYNGMIAPIAGYPIRGPIWYQGESTAGQAYLYRRLFPAMIKVWRDKWGEGNFPFLFVRLAPFTFEDVGTEPRDSYWAELRESQLLTAKNAPYTGKAVITDVADPDPKDKETVGKKLATIYGEGTEYYGPLYKSMRVKDGKAIISFTTTSAAHRVLPP